MIQEQLKDGVVEPVPDDPEGKEFYIPHKGVFRETAESTKLRSFMMHRQDRQRNPRR